MPATAATSRGHLGHAGENTDLLSLSLSLVTLLTDVALGGPGRAFSFLRVTCTGVTTNSLFQPEKPTLRRDGGSGRCAWSGAFRAVFCAVTSSGRHRNFQNENLPVRSQSRRVRPRNPEQMEASYTRRPAGGPRASPGAAHRARPRGHVAEVASPGAALHRQDVGAPTRGAGGCACAGGRSALSPASMPCDAPHSPGHAATKPLSAPEDGRVTWTVQPQTAVRPAGVRGASARPRALVSASPGAGDARTGREQQDARREVGVDAGAVGGTRGSVGDVSGPQSCLRADTRRRHGPQTAPRAAEGPGRRAQCSGCSAVTMAAGFRAVPCPTRGGASSACLAGGESVTCV